MGTPHGDNYDDWIKLDERLREPNLEASPEATRRLVEMANAPHDPAAAKVNLARAEDALRNRRAALRGKK